MAAWCFLCYDIFVYIIKGDARAGIRMKLILPKSKVNAEAMMGEEMVFVHTVHTEKKSREVKAV